MNINKIREAGNKMRDALRQYIGDGVGGPHVEALSSWSKAIAELDKAQQPGKVLTDQRVTEILLHLCRERKVSYAGMFGEGALKALRHVRDNGYIAPAAGLTVEVAEQVVKEWCLEWVERVAPDTTDWYSLRSRLTAAIEAKTNNK